MKPVRFLLLFLIHEASAVLKVEAPDIYHARVGSSIHIPCTFSVDVPPINPNYLAIFWKFEGKEILHYDNVVKTLDPRASINTKEATEGIASLSLVNIKITDGGLYTCSVLYSPERMENTVMLRIEALPKITITNNIVVENMESVLRSSVSGFFPIDIDITWLRDGQILKNMNTYKPQKNSDGTYQVNSTVSIMPSARNQDQTFSCRVQHESLIAPFQEDFKLVYGAVPMIDISSPTFLMDKEETLICRVWGFYPENITVNWFLNGTLMKTPHIWKVNSSTLESSIQFLTKAEYQGLEISCVIEHGTLSSPLVKKLVVEPKAVPMIDISSPTFLMDKEETLICRVWGFYPENITVNWFLNGTLMKTPHIWKVNSSTLESSIQFLTKAEYQGLEISCVIENGTLSSPLVKKLVVEPKENKTFKEKKGFFSSTPGIAVVIIVTLVIIAGVIIAIYCFTCHKTKQKSSSENSPSKEMNLLIPPTEKSSSENAPSKEMNSLLPPTEKSSSENSPSEEMNPLLPPTEKSSSENSPSEEMNRLLPPTEKSSSENAPSEEINPLLPPTEKSSSENSPSEEMNRLLPPTEKSRCENSPSKEMNSLLPPTEKSSSENSPSEEMNSLLPPTACLTVENIYLGNDDNLVLKVFRIYSKPISIKWNGWNGLNDTKKKNCKLLQSDTLYHENGDGTFNATSTCVITEGTIDKNNVYTLQATVEHDTLKAPITRQITQACLTVENIYHGKDDNFFLTVYRIYPKSICIKWNGWNGLNDTKKKDCKLLQSDTLYHENGDGTFNAISTCVITEGTIDKNNVYTLQATVEHDTLKAPITRQITQEPANKLKTTITSSITKKATGDSHNQDMRKAKGNIFPHRSSAQVKAAKKNYLDNHLGKELQEDKNKNKVPGFGSTFKEHENQRSRKLIEEEKGKQTQRQPPDSEKATSGKQVRENGNYKTEKSGKPVPGPSPSQHEAESRESEIEEEHFSQQIARDHLQEELIGQNVIKPEEPDRDEYAKEEKIETIQHKLGESPSQHEAESRESEIEEEHFSQQIARDHLQEELIGQNGIKPEEPDRDKYSKKEKIETIQHKLGESPSQHEAEPREHRTGEIPRQEEDESVEL